MRTIRWLGDARQEALEVAAQYAELDPELGEDLWSRIESRLTFALRFPHIGRLVAEISEVELRRHLLDRFKYTLVLAATQDEVVVVAFHHNVVTPTIGGQDLRKRGSKRSREVTRRREAGEARTSSFTCCATAPLDRWGADNDVPSRPPTNTGPKP